MGAAIYSVSGHSRPVATMPLEQHKPRVLVVDDEEPVLQMVRDVLEEEGLDVLTAREGRAALQMALHSRPNVIVTDLMMPGMDGRALCKRLGQEPITARIPVIVMSAAFKPRPDDAFAAVLPKPFEIDDLIGHVNRYLP